MNDNPDPVAEVVRIYGRGIKEAVCACDTQPGGWHSIAALARIVGMLIRVNSKEGEDKKVLVGAAEQMFYGMHLLKLEEVIPEGETDNQVLRRHNAELLIALRARDAVIEAMNAKIHDLAALLNDLKHAKPEQVECFRNQIQARLDGEGYVPFYNPDGST